MSNFANINEMSILSKRTTWLEKSKRPSFRRVIYVAGIVPNPNIKSEDLKSYHERVIEKLLTLHTDPMVITGIAVIYNDCLVHLLEGPYDTVTSLFRLFKTSSEGNNNQIFENMKVVLASEDCYERYFENWSVHINQNPNEKQQSITQETLVDDCWSLVQKFTTLGEFMKSTSSSTTEDNGVIVDKKKIFTLLPTIDDIKAFVQSSSGIPTIAEYLDIFDSPISVDFEEENIWPAQPVIDFKVEV